MAKPTGPAFAGDDRGGDLVAAAADWLWECDAGGSITFISEQFQDSTSVSSLSLLGKPLADLGAPPSHRALIAAAKPFRDLVLRLDRADGGHAWIEMGGAPVFQGELFRGYRGIGKTVTARVEAELECRRYRQLVDLACDWLWETDADNRLVHVSATSTAVLGLPPSAYHGKRLAETEGVVIDTEAGRANLAAIKARHRYRDFVYSRKLPDGRVIWISASGAPVHGEDGTFLGYRGTARDVTVEIEAERNLRQSEMQYRDLFEIAADWHWECNFDGYATFLSENYETVFGQPRAEFLGKRIYGNPSVSIDVEMGKMILEARLEQRAFRDFLHARTFPDGTKRWFKLSAKPLWDEDGNLRGYRGIGAEVTKSVEAEVAAKLARRRLDEAVAHVTQPFVVFDANDRAIAFNQAYFNLHRNPSYPDDVRIPATYVPVQEGVSLRAILEWELTIDFYARGPGEAAMDIETLLASHRSDGEHTCHLRDGRWMLVTYRRLPGDARVGLWSDITAIKRAEAELRRGQEHLAHAQRVSQVGSALHDPVSGTEEWSDELYRILGLTPGVVTPSFDALLRRIHEEDRAALIAAQAAFHKGESRRMAEYRVVRDDGSERIVQSAFEALSGDDGRPTQLLFIFHDVTELRRSEAQQRALQRQLLHAQKLDALGVLAGGVAHEINNALVPVIALTQLVARRLPNDSREQRNLGMVLAGAERSRNLVKQILAFSRREQGEQRIEGVDVGAVLREALQLMRATLPASIQVEDEITLAPPVIGDPSQLHQVIVNLMTNAAQAIGEAQGRIYVSLRPEAEDAQLHLAVADDGCGMDQATVARIFEPFFTTRPVGEGTGLGLFVAHGIVRAHGGRIEVESTPGQGSRFDVFLPVVPALTHEAA
jgi:PAS domain S-box-containing protein